MGFQASTRKWLLSISVLSFLYPVSASALPKNQTADTINDWELILPSANLEWIPCFQNFTCAKLEVPLDYGYPNRGTTAIAFIKLAAKKATEHTRSVLINPGGPGGSGVDVVLANTLPFASVIGEEHNLIGFDPRGVGQSGPHIDCWPNHPEKRAAFERLFYSETSYASSTSLSTQFYAADFFGEACNSTVGGPSGNAAFVSAPAVARDLLAFIKADHAAAGKPADEAKLAYYGISYGTLLGTTFAHMFPEHVGPMILDGVLDVEDVYELGWTQNLYEADKAIGLFYEYCHRGGKENCAFWGPSAHDIQRRAEQVLARLKYNPIPVASSEACSLPLLATYSGLKEFALQASLVPAYAFPVLAAVFAGLEKGDATAYVSAVTGGLAANPCNNGTSGTTKDITVLLKCVDGYDGDKLETLAQYRDYVDNLSTQSHFFGEVWPNNANTVLCRSFDVEPPASGRLNGSILDHRDTATPILFVSSAVDPLTPKRGAYKMSQAFRGSTVLIQDTVGHTAIGGATSCLTENAQAYFASGKLPAPYTVCKPDLLPFQSPPSASRH